MTEQAKTVDRYFDKVRDAAGSPVALVAVLGQMVADARMKSLADVAELKEKCAAYEEEVNDQANLLARATQERNAAETRLAELELELELKRSRP
jgi:hypothetical protein